MDNFVRFWGVRGSIPSSGPSTAGVGGNTSCVEVRLGGRRFILDGGTGLHRLGMAQASVLLEAHLLFGHLHWDHIQGVPFFGPLFDPRSRVAMVGPAGLKQTLDAQMSGPSFPVGMEVMGARKRFEELSPGDAVTVGDVQITTAPLSHPGGGLAYRLQHGDVSVVYACDTEHPRTGLDRALLRLATDATVLIYDAMYLPHEYPSRVGWGHSTWEQGVRLALAARVSRLLLTHHDPTRDDEGVARMEQSAAMAFAGARAAREGMCIALSDGAGLATPGRRLARAGDRA